MGNLMTDCCCLFGLLALAAFALIAGVLSVLARGAALMERKDWLE